MARLAWEPEAEKALARAPFFVRPLARRKIEERVRRRGGDRVTLADFAEAEARFRAIAGDKSNAELQRLMPQPNQPGAELVAIEVCHAELSGCPNRLIRPAEWKQAIEAWAKEKNVSERLRARVTGERVLYHHKLRIAIAGCPNACSRPQIADVGLVGFVRPIVDAAQCVFCGACAEACPDRAITVEGAPARVDREACQGCRACAEACARGYIALSEPAARILAGGKLGRHPHLAEVAAIAESPEEAVRWLDAAVEDFLERAKPGERFAEFWIRTRGEASVCAPM